MGGRGGSGYGGSTRRKTSKAGSSDGAFPSNRETVVETIYRESRGWSPSYYTDEVLEAKTDGNGNLTFSYARGGKFEKVSKTNRTNNVTFNILAGAKNGETFNIDWSKVNSISGQTYSLRSKAKQEGLKWDSSSKSWKRP